MCAETPLDLGWVPVAVVALQRVPGVYCGDCCRNCAEGVTASSRDGLSVNMHVFAKRPGIRCATHPAAGSRCDTNLTRSSEKHRHRHRCSSQQPVLTRRRTHCWRCHRHWTAPSAAALQPLVVISHLIQDRYPRWGRHSASSASKTRGALLAVRPRSSKRQLP